MAKLLRGIYFKTLDKAFESTTENDGSHHALC